MTPSTPDAIARTQDLARSLGLESAPVVIADRSNLVLRLDPHPIVARVAIATSMVRVGMEWLRREVDVSRHLAARGVEVTHPCTRIEAGPHERDGLVVSFWELETLVEAPVDPAVAGARLAQAHRALRDFSATRLPEWGAWTEARTVLDRARRGGSLDAHELRSLDAAWDRAERVVASARARSASFQPVHGDAHLGNVLSTARDAVWTDWEDAFVGPVEHDLACLRSRADLFGEERAAIDAALAAYDEPHDAALVADLGVVRNVQVIVWLAVFAERQPELLPRMRARLALCG